MLLLVGSGVVAALTAAVALIAIVLTTALARYTSEVERAHSATRAVERVREALLQLSEDSDVAYLTKEPDDERVRSEREAALMSRSAEARIELRDGSHHDSLEDAMTKTQDYLVARRQAELSGGTLDNVLHASAAPRRDALDATGRIAEQLSAELEVRSERARKLGAVADDVVAISGGLCVALLAAIMVGLYRGLFGPLLQLTDAIRAFAAGDRGARASLNASAELNELADTFNELADRQVRQDIDRMTFLAGVAHDLRNPLATLRVVTHHLGPARPPPTEQKLRASMALIDRQVTRLERMVGDFLDASRIESGHLELRPEPVDLRMVVRDAVELYRTSTPAGAGRHIALREPESGLTVDVDAFRIGQVLNNLLSNALKYSPGAAEVLVSVERDGDDAVVSVIDHGIGIAPADLPHVFEPFRRTGASRELAPGVGLGLSVSRRIIEAHHGRIDVVSSVGSGSTFSVRLPLVVGVPAEQSAALH